jgi:hypothetical protein
MASVGAEDIRLNAQGKLTYRLQQQLKGYTRTDAPPTRVKPIPFTIVDHANRIAAAGADPMSHAIADVATIGFFFLLRPGEHTLPSAQSDSKPFRLIDVNFLLGALSLNAATGDLERIKLAAFSTLTFTTQKNAVSGEIIGHARSGHNLTCPVLALIRRVCHLRLHNAAPTTQLCTVYRSLNDIAHVTPALLTAQLRCSAGALYPVLGFAPADISACALRAGGAMALLCAQVDTDIIKLVGRWKSDVMLRYLHLQAYPHMRNFAALMVSGGNFRLLSNQNIPAAAVPLFAAAAAAADASRTVTTTTL